MNPKQAIIVSEFSYRDEDSSLVHLKRGDRIHLVESISEKWWKATRDSDKILRVPSSHIQIIDGNQTPPPNLGQKSRLSTSVSMPVFDQTAATIMGPRNNLKNATNGNGHDGGTATNSEQSDDTTFGSSHESLEDDVIGDDEQTSTNNHCDYANLDAIEMKPGRFRKPAPIYMNLPIVEELNTGRRFRKLPPPPINNAKMKRRLFGDWFEYYDENGRLFYYNSLEKLVSWKPPRRSTTRIDPNDVLAAQERLKAGVDSFNHHYHHQPDLKKTTTTTTVVDESDRHSDTEVVLNNNINRVQGIVKSFNNDDSLLYNLKRTPTFPKKQQMQLRYNSHNNNNNNNGKPLQQSYQNGGGGGNGNIIMENPLSIISNLLNHCPPDHWRRCRDPSTNETCFVSEKWFCKQDDMGRICFFEKSTPAPEAAGGPDGGGGGGDIIPKMRNFDAYRDNRDYLDEIDPKYAEQIRHLNHERSLRAHSVAMISSSEDSSFAGIQIQGEFKHSRPFQDVKIDVPPPPYKLDAKDIILHDSLMHARTLIQGKHKRKHWSTIYAVLTRHYLFLFKDQKNMYSTRLCEFTIALLNAQVQWCPTESSKKNCFKIVTFQNQTMFQDDDKMKSVRWFTTITDFIKRMPHLVYIPTETAEEEFEFRRRTRSQAKQPEDFSIQGSHTISGYTKFSHPSPSNKRKIRERLLNFLKKRPPVESLREKGIFKDENVFGCNLEQLCQRENGNIPKFVRECVQAIEKNDIIADGIYRACGNLSTVQKLRFEINQDNYQGLCKETDVHVQTGLLKMFFREMKEPLLPYDRFEPLIKMITIPDRETKLESFKNLVHNLPEPNYQTLKFILQHLLRVESYSEQNRMHIQNLAIVFGPTLIRAPNDLHNLVFDMMLQVQQSQVIEFLLQEYYSIFEF